MLTIISLVHGLALFGLFFLGAHRTHLLWHYESKKHHFSKPNSQINSDILVQIPVYNEANVIEDCLAAVAHLQWKNGNLTIHS